MKRKTQLIIACLFMLTLSFSCKKANYVGLESDEDYPTVNQTVTYKLNSYGAEKYYVKIADTSFFLTETNTFDYTWTRAGTFSIDVAAYRKNGNARGHYCTTVYVFNDQRIYEGNYLLEGTCDDYTISAAAYSLQTIKLSNFANLGFDVVAETHGNLGRALTIHKQNFIGEDGIYSISGQGILNGAEDQLELEYIIDYEDSNDPDLNYHEFCKMDGLKL